MSAEQPPQEILDLLRQQEEIQKKLQVWKEEQEAKKIKEQEKVELKVFVGNIMKKRSFSRLKYTLPPPKRLKRVFHNVKIIQKKEEELAKERSEVKQECVKEIEEYLNASLSTHRDL